MSFDKPAENAEFRAKQQFEYPLWSDGAKALARHYGVIRAAIQPYASRVTLVLNPRGEVHARVPGEGQSVSAADHAAAALKILDDR